MLYPHGWICTADAALRAFSEWFGVLRVYDRRVLRVFFYNRPSLTLVRPECTSSFLRASMDDKNWPNFPNYVFPPCIVRSSDITVSDEAGGKTFPSYTIAGRPYDVGMHDLPTEMVTQCRCLDLTLMMIPYVFQAKGANIMEQVGSFFEGKWELIHSC